VNKINYSPCYVRDKCSISATYTLYTTNINYSNTYAFFLNSGFSLLRNRYFIKLLFIKLPE